MAPDLRIAFLTRKNPYDKKSWSGANYRLFHTLAAFYSITWVRPTQRNWFWVVILRGLVFYFQQLLGKIIPMTTIYYSRSVAEHISKKLENYDVVFCMSSPELLAFARIPLGTKVIYFTDAAFDQLLDAYPNYRNFPKWAVRHSQLIERRALGKSAGLLVTSNWAADYLKQISPSPLIKTVVAPLGPSLEEVPTPTWIQEAMDSRLQNTTLTLLFIGKHWERKGGPLALELFHILESAINVKLYVVGCDVTGYSTTSNIHIYPYIDTSSYAGMDLFRRLWRESHFLLLPTKADCVPNVIAESFLHAVPVITTAVGGIPNVVDHLVDGVCFTVHDSATHYANIILEIFQDKIRYADMQSASLNKYVNKLNYESWMNTFHGLLKDLECI